MNHDTAAPGSRIRLARDGAVMVLTLDHPASLNSLGLDTIKQLLAAIRALAHDGQSRALLITGAGRAFCAGWQLDESGVPGLPDESFGVPPRRCNGA